MDNATEVAVVGGGAAGCAVAYYLAKVGVKATIIERDAVGSKASGYSAGGLNPLQGAGIPGPLGPLAMESFRMHLEMREQLKGESDVDFQPQTVSMVRVAFAETELPELEETLEIFDGADGFSAHWMDGSELRELEPRISRDAVRALYTYGNAALDSYLYTLALSRAAERLGATVRVETARGVRTSGARVTGVLLDDGEIECDRVVIATGPWSAEAERWLGVSMPIEPLKGEILRMELPDRGTLAHDFSWGNVSLFHRADGLVWVGTTEERRGFDIQPSATAQQTLLDGAARLMPAMADARLVKHTACLRPVTSDWLPIVGKAPHWDNVYLATGAGKKGILISPGIGKAIADLITEGETRLSIGPLAPGRFAEARA